MIRIKSSYPTRVPIDGHAVEITVARMEVGDATRFRRAYDRFTSPESIRILSRRQPGEESEKHPVPRPRTPEENAAIDALAALDAVEPAPTYPPEVSAVIAACRELVREEPITEVFVIPAAEIRRRRMADMSSAEREAFEALDAREDVENDAFIIDTISRFVTVKEGQIEEVDATTGERNAITAGADLARVFSSRQDVLIDLVNVVRLENFLPENRKALWRTMLGAAVDTPADDLGMSSITSPENVEGFVRV